MQFTVQKNSDQLTVTLQGDLNEDCNAALQAVRAQLPQDCRAISFDMQHVKWINSFGIKVWLNFVNHLNANRIKLEYQNCPVAFIDYVNLTPTITGGGNVVSFYAPFVCSKCHGDHQIKYLAAQVSAGTIQANHSCPKCGGTLRSDVDLEEYMLFITNPAKA